MNKTVVVLLLTLLMPFVANAQQAPERTWQMRTGGRIVARYAGSSDTGRTFILRFHDGHEESFDINDFSSDDQKWIINWNSPQKENALLTITEEGIGTSLEKAIASAEKSALMKANGFAHLGKDKIIRSGFDRPLHYNEEYSLWCGFIKNELILDIWTDDDGAHHVKIRFQVYQRVLSPYFAKGLSQEENARRNESINKQVLYIYKLLFDSLKFPDIYYKFKTSNVSIHNNTFYFDITTSCDSEGYMSLSSDLRFILDKFAIKRGNFHMKTSPFDNKDYPQVFKFHEYDVSRSIVDLKTYKDRIFVCICVYVGNDGSTSWEVFELSKKFMFLFEPYAHLMMGIQVDILDRYGNVMKSLPPVLPEVKPFSPRAASFVGIWDARFRSRMKDEGVRYGSQFATFNPAQPYNYEYVYNRFNGKDPLANAPYSSVYSIQPFFLSRFNDKTNLIFPKLTRRFGVDLTPEQIRRLPSDYKRAIRVRMAPINGVGKQYLQDLERNLENEIE